MSFTVTLTFEDRQIADLLCGALEGGSNYWIAEMKVHLGKDDANPYGEEACPGYLRAPFATEGKVIINPIDEKGVTLNREAIQKGLHIFASLKDGAGGHHFPNWIAGADDAETADVFLQCCVFGKIIFG